VRLHFSYNGKLLPRLSFCKMQNFSTVSPPFALVSPIRELTFSVEQAISGRANSPS
jgi:hypothetical protein